MTKTVLGIFDSRANCEDAITDLEDAGYRAKDISIVMRDQGEAQTIVNNTGASIADETVTGAATGAVIGGIAGLLIGVGAIVIPGIGGVLIGGPLAVGLGLTGAAATTAEGAFTGIIAGGIIGALVGWGMPEEDARVYADRIKTGAIVLAVPAQTGRSSEVRGILEDHGATDVRTISAAEDRVHTYNEADDEYVDDYRPTYTTHHVVAKGGRAHRRRVVEEED